LGFSGRPEKDSAAGTVLSSTREVESCPALRDLFGIYLEQPECSINLVRSGSYRLDDPNAIS
jgi:hypothetical protein